jgi:ribosome recycling factor
MANEIIQTMQEEMDSSLQSFKRELSKVRTGRASTGLVDSLQVDYYGSNVPVSQVANISTPDARTIQVVPWESNLIGAIEKAILAANIGLNPQNDGKLIRIPLPPLTEERRKEMVKAVKKLGEEAKIAARNHRRHANEEIKKKEKAKELPEDDAKRAMEVVQKKTDEKVAEIDKMVEAKEKEMLTV